MKLSTSTYIGLDVTVEGDTKDSHHVTLSYYGKEIKDLAVPFTAALEEFYSMCKSNIPEKLNIARQTYFYKTPVIIIDDKNYKLVVLKTVLEEMILVHTGKKHLNRGRFNPHISLEKPIKNLKDIPHIPVKGIYLQYNGEEIFYISLNK